MNEFNKNQGVPKWFTFEYIVLACDFFVIFSTSHHMNTTLPNAIPELGHSSCNDKILEKKKINILKFFFYCIDMSWRCICKYFEDDQNKQEAFTEDLFNTSPKYDLTVNNIRNEYRSSHWTSSLKKDVLYKCKFHRKTFVLESLYNAGLYNTF